MINQQLYSDKSIFTLEQAAIHICGLESFTLEKKHIIEPIYQELKQSALNGDLEVTKLERHRETRKVISEGVDFVNNWGTDRPKRKTAVKKETYIDWQKSTVLLGELKRWLSENRGSDNSNVGDKAANTYNKTIAILARMYIETIGGGRLGNLNKPNNDAVYNDFKKHIEEHKIKSHGLGKSSFSEKLSSGLKALDFKTIE